jgi:transposase
MRNVPGRKTDMKDAEWIATLLRHGLVASSFVPPPPIRELRDLVRYRTKLVQARSAEHNRLLKLLETANIKLASVASNVFGVSGVLMLKALIAGNTGASAIAELAKGRLRKKLGELTLALEGRIEEHHRFILAMQIERIQEIDAHVANLDGRLFAKMEPYAEIHARLTEIPGVDRIVAAVIIAELGVDMTVFADEHHLASWAGVCPGNNESAGKRKSGRARKGNPHLRAVLVQAATGAGRTGGTYLKDKYHRLRARRGPKRAALAVAHKILISAYHLIRTAVPYRELGAAYLDDVSRNRTTRSLVRRLERMGYHVDLQQAA